MKSHPPKIACIGSGVIGSGWVSRALAHGLDVVAANKQYEPFLEGVGSRSDLNYLFAEMMGNITVSVAGRRVAKRSTGGRISGPSAACCTKC